MNNRRGTTIKTTIKRVVDGDTLYVDAYEKSIRILSLDTEESRSTGGKPVTPWGKQAAKRAMELLPEGCEVILEFQGQDSPQDVWKRYVDNYGRGLAWVHFDDGNSDFQEIMIREGYSPYFSKYGYAEWPDLHQKYVQAEREAQKATIGIWNQIAVNGSEMRNYAVLGVWWDLRAQLIEGYRNYKSTHPTAVLYNTRKDYLELIELARNSDEVTIFTELRSIKRVGGIHGAISIGSNEQPFSIFIKNLDDPKSQQIVNLLTSRYLPTEDERYPRRSYAYVEGKLQLYNDRPQIVIEDPDAIRDSL